MDVNDTLKVILDTIADYELLKATRPNKDLLDFEDTVIEHLDALLSWLKQGGFMPKLPQGYRPNLLEALLASEKVSQGYKTE
jgi:hypothetical protein